MSFFSFRLLLSFPSFSRLFHFKLLCVTCVHIHKNRLQCALSKCNTSCTRPPLWSSGHSSWLQILRSRVRFQALPDFLRSSGSGTGSTQPREDN
jgi:hypothetical protein